MSDLTINRETTFIVGVLAFGMLQIVSVYEATAPDLQELRSTEPGDAKQRLFDADVMVGFTVLLVVGAATYATRSLLPIIMLGGAFVIVSGWHHMVHNGDVV